VDAAAPTDAASGLDASPDVDGGPGDDGGIDASAMDGGSVDADGSTTDGGTTDGGTTDGGTTDGGTTDAGNDACTPERYWPDSDGDGYGNPSATPVDSCVPLRTYVTNDTDCDDGAASVNPGATEVVGDEIDQNCDGGEICYRDTDNDGYRTTATVSSSDVDCIDPGEARSGDPAGDCNDTNPTVRPGAADICANGVDEDCNGTPDDAPECSVACDWTGARWLSHGWDGGMAFAVGAWFSCVSGRLAYVERVGSMFSFTPPARGTGDLQVGCNWTGSRWASQGIDGGAAFTHGATAACSGGRVTSMSWETSTLTGTARTGDLGCNWSGGLFISHGIDGGCAFQTGLEITCSGSRITHFQWVEGGGCPRVR
jgi:hypothetical protein